MFRNCRWFKRAVIFSLAAQITAAAGPGLVYAKESDEDKAREAEEASGVLKAIQGYDPVAYFREGRPVRGKKEHYYDRGSERWYFASEDNKLRFIEYPEKYLPRYGGYAALEVAEGKKIQADPKVWSVVDGRLYLHKSISSLAQWEKEQDENIERGDYQWPRIR